MAAEVKEIIERFRDRGMEDVIAALALTQGNLDPTSFIAGLLLSKGGGGLDRTAALLLALSGSNMNAQQQGTGTTTNPMQQMLPLLLLLGRDDLYDKGVEVIERKRG